MRLLASLSNRRLSTSLVCPLGRPFSLGTLRMKLLPSGSILGGASLLLHGLDAPILYAPMLQPQKVPTLPQLQLEEAQVLITRTPLGDSAHMPTRKRESERLQYRVAGMIREGMAPVIFCDNIAAVPDVVRCLTDIGAPVAVERRLLPIVRTYEQCGSVLGPHGVVSPKRESERVQVVHFQNLRALRTSRPREVLTVSNRVAEPDAQDSYLFATHASLAELKQIVARVGAKELVLFGPRARQFAEEFRHLVRRVDVLFPFGQPPLLENVSHL